MRSRRLSFVVAGSAALWLLSVLPVSSDPAENGESWEVTSQMSMVGVPMQMPTQTQRVCARRDQAPAENPDPNCRNTGVSRVGNKVTWEVQCTGDHPMTGRAEIVYSSADAYTGTIRFESSDGVMLLKLNGKRLGSCRAPG